MPAPGYFAPKGSVPPTVTKKASVNNRPVDHTAFRKLYDRGDFPIVLNHGSGMGHNKLVWKVELEKLDYHHYLPLFFSGLAEVDEPYALLARQGVLDMLAKGGEERVLPVVPQLIIPIKTALNTNNPIVICQVLEVIQKLVECGDRIGQELVPYYRQILPTFNAYKNKNVNLGDGIYYSQQKRRNLGDLIQETLEIMETHGGDDAFINIKYMIPTYESCVVR